MAKKIPIKMIGHSPKVNLREWVFDALEELDLDELIKKVASEAINCALEEPARAWIPALWSDIGSEDGIGGPLVDDPLTIYIELPLGETEDNNPVWALSLSAAVDDFIEGKICCGGPDEGKITARPGDSALRLRDALRAEAQKIDDVIVMEPDEPENLISARHWKSGPVSVPFGEFEQIRYLRSMVYGADWTGKMVLERLVAFFALDPSVALGAERGDLFPVDPAIPVDGLDIVRAVLKVLGPRSPAAKMLLARARASAKGISVAELCRETGWAPATLNRWVDVASDDVAAWLIWRNGQLLPTRTDRGKSQSSIEEPPCAGGISHE